MSSSEVTFKWRQLSVANAPLPRSSHDVTVVDKKLILLWGEHEPRQPIPEKDEINTLDLSSLGSSLESLSWSTSPTSGSRPAPRLAHAQAVVGSSLYIFGGREGVSMGEGALNDMYVLDTSSFAWTLVSPEGAVPEARSFHKMVGTEKGLYLFGGCAAVGRLNDFWFYSIADSQWTQLPSPPATPRGGPSLSATSSNTHVYLATGYSGSENDDTYVFDVAAGTWETVVPFGSGQFRARSVCPSVLLQDGRYFVVACGEVSTSDRGHEGAGDFASDIVVLREGKTVQYDMATGSDAITPRGWTAMAKIDERTAVLFGGLAGNDEMPVRLNDTWILEIVDNAAAE